MLKVLQQLKFAVCPLCEDGRTERLHDFFNRDRLSSKLVFCRTGEAVSKLAEIRVIMKHLPDKAESSHPNRLKIGIPTVELAMAPSPDVPLPATYRLVISNVVPKIWARTNSAMVYVACCCRRGQVRITEASISM